MESTPKPPTQEYTAGLPEASGAGIAGVGSGVPTASMLTKVKRILGQDAGLVDTQVIVAGWIKTIRFGGRGRLAFISINDGSSMESLQVVIDKDKEGFLTLSDPECATGASLWAAGRVVKSIGKGQAVELLADKVGLIGGCAPLEYPLAGREISLEVLREVAHLRPRTNRFGAMARVRSALSFATHQFFQERGFLNVHTPLITCSDCEGAGELFQVTAMLGGQQIPRTPAGEVDFAQDFFGRPSYLTVSGQLNAEFYACGLGSVYTFGPAFRAENANTRRHLAEFWMVEPEMAFYDLRDTMDLAEAYVKFCIQHVLTRCAKDMEWLDSVFEGESGLLARLKHAVDAPFARVTYTEAVQALLRSGAKFEHEVYWGVDLSSEHERYLTEQVYRRPTFVTDYPKEIKAFYMRVNDDGKTVAAMDLLMPHLGELIGGSQREERLDVLRQQFKDHRLAEEPYKAYLDTRRFGSVPHSGFGLGFERLVMVVTGIDNIRDVIPFPRYPKHALF